MPTKSSAAIGALTAWTLLYVAVGLAPFHFNFDEFAQPRVFFFTPINGTLNYIFFVPLGVLIARLGVGRPILTATMYCATLSLSVECLQLFIPGRFAALPDWALNACGGTSGALLVRLRGAGVA